MGNLSLEILVIFAILAVAVFFFVTEWVRADVVAVLVTVSLAVSGILTPGEAFSGFSSDAVMAIAALLIVGSGMVRTGVVRWMSERLQGLIKGGRLRLKIAGTAVPGILSGFINIIAAISIFIPAVTRLSIQNKVNPSTLLLPMAAASLAGANLTLIGAAHNLVVNDLLGQSGAETFGFFEFTLVGVVILAAVLAYCVVAGRWLLPEGRKEDDKDDLGDESDLLHTYGIGQRLWEIWIAPGSSVSGKTVHEIGIGRKYGLGVIVVIRDGDHLSVDRPDFRVDDDDVLAVVGREDRLKALESANPGIVLMGRPKLQDEFSWSIFNIVDVAVPPRSKAAGQTLREMKIRKNTHLTGIAIWRDGKSIRTEVRDRPLQVGDGILLFGTREAVRNFAPAPDFVWLTPPAREEAPPELRHLGPFALAIMAAVILVAAMGWVPVAVAALAGAATMVILGILTPKKAYESIDWKTIVIVAGMYPVGQALDKSGAASAMAELLVNTAGIYGPHSLMAGIALFSILLTQAMHNAVVAVIMTPVAVQAAAAANVDPKAFAIAVIVGASATFLLPVGHPALMLVQRPGGYATMDYAKFGIGLIVIVFAIIILVPPFIWPF
jgi:di/tricarboxylate transporter